MRRRKSAWIVGIALTHRAAADDVQQCLDWMASQNMPLPPPLVDEAAAQRTLTFLQLEPTTPAAVLASHGFEVAQQLDDDDEPGAMFPSPAVLHVPRQKAALRRCAAVHRMAEVPVQRAQWSVVRVRNASATFEGFGITASGAVFAPRAESIPLLVHELLHPRLRHAYRHSSQCSARVVAGASPCCLSVGGGAQSALEALFVAPEGGEGGRVAVSPRVSAFYEELGLFGERLRQCAGRAGGEASSAAAGSAAAGGGVAIDELLLFQPLFSSNFFHFIAEGLPRLLRAPRPQARGPARPLVPSRVPPVALTHASNV